MSACRWQWLTRPRRRGGARLASVLCGGVSLAILPTSMSRNNLLAIATCTLWCVVSGVCAADWPHWRGPLFTGASGETGLPDRLDAQHRVWQVTLPGLGASTPVVWGDRVFISALDRETSDLVALCFRRQDGELLWRQVAGVGFHPQQRDDLVSPSAVCADDVVVFTFGSGDVLACAHDGTVRWRRNLQKEHGRFTNQWIYASTPLLLDDLLHIQVLQTNADAQADTPRTTSYVLGLDAATGVQRWKHPRRTTARGESQDAYTSPLPAGSGAERVVLVYGGDCLTAHDPSTGNERWRQSGWNGRRTNNWRTIASPVPCDGQVVLCTARGTRLAAVPLAPPADGSTWTPRWEHDHISSDVAVPAYHGGRLYVLHGDHRELACLDPADGTVFWRGTFDTDAVIRASPTIADGRLYCLSESGEVLVFASERFELLSRTVLGSDHPSRASIAVAYGQVFVRTSDVLYAFQRAAAAK